MRNAKEFERLQIILMEECRRFAGKKKRMNGGDDSERGLRN